MLKMLPWTPQKQSCPVGTGGGNIQNFEDSVTKILNVRFHVAIGDDAMERRGAKSANEGGLIHLNRVLKEAPRNIYI